MAIYLDGIRKKKRKDFKTIYVQDFNDDYHKSKDTFDDILLKAKNLKSQYTNVIDFREAEEVYNEYMAYLIEINGGKKRFNLLKKNKRIKQFLPIKPTLKETQAIKDFNKYGIMNSGFLGKISPANKKVIFKKANEMIQDELLDELEDNELDITDIQVDIDYSDYSDSYEDMLAIFQRETRKDDKKGMYRGGTDTDLLMNLFRQRQKKVQEKDNRFDMNELRVPTLTQMLSDNYDPDEWFITEAEYRGSENEFVNVNGRLVKKDQMENYELAKAFEKYGLDLEDICANKKSYMEAHGKDSALFQALNNYKKLSKKEQKKLSKKNKKRAEKNKKLAAESALEVVRKELGFNVDSYDEYKDMMLHGDSMGGSDWFKNL